MKIFAHFPFKKKYNRGDKNTKRKVPCTDWPDSVRFTQLWLLWLLKAFKSFIFQELTSAALSQICCFIQKISASFVLLLTVNRLLRVEIAGSLALSPFLMGLDVSVRSWSEEEYFAKVQSLLPLAFASRLTVQLKIQTKRDFAKKILKV